MPEAQVLHVEVAPLIVPGEQARVGKVVDQFVGAHEAWLEAAVGGVPPHVLERHYAQVAEGVGHVQSGVADGEVQLLGAVALVHVPAGLHLRVDPHLLLEDQQAAGQDQVLLIIVTEHLQEIIPRAGRSHPVVGHFQRVVEVGLEGVEAEAGRREVVGERTFQVLSFRHIARSPVRIAVHQGVAQVLGLVLQVVEMQFQPVPAAKLQDGL